jgi:hypothetical protein
MRNEEKGYLEMVNYDQRMNWRLFMILFTVSVSYAYQNRTKSTVELTNHKNKYCRLKWGHA